MKVRQLLKILNKMPKNLDVYSADHDHGEFETNTILNYCELINKEEMTEYNNDTNSGLSDTFQSTPKKYVVIRP